MMGQKRCPACRHEGMSVFIEIADLPVHCNLLWPSREAALNAPRGHIRLGFCRACGMIYNLSFDPSRMQYTQAYENSLHFSPHFQKYAQELATRLTEKYHLYGKTIVEIGCGKGEFLSILCEGGGNQGVGFDPTYGGNRERNGPENITFIRDFYSEAYAGYTPDLICCRQVLEHIQYPREFLLQLRRAIGDRQDTVVFFEVPNVLYTLCDFGIWDIIYEHCSYFSAPSLTRIFEESGFRVLQVYPTFGDQFLCLEAFPAIGDYPKDMASAEDLEQLSGFVSAFKENYRFKVKTWEENLNRLLEKGRRIVAWGAGSKGVTFLNTISVGGEIRYVVDINPYKQERYIAGTGQQIVSPQYLREYRPDTVLLMNPIYKNEVQEKIAEVGITTEVVVV